MAFFGGINTNKKKSTSKKTVKKAPKSLSDFRRSVGLDKDKNKGIKTIQDSDKLSVRQKDRVDQAQGLADRYAKEGLKSTDEGIRRISSKYPTQGDFFKDLKDAYKSGLFTGGNKTKDLMFKYGLSSDQIRDLRVGIDQGLGTRIGDGGNILSDILKDRQYILAEYSGNYAADQDDIRSSARNIYEPGMSRFDKLPIYENPEGIFQTAANFTNQYNPILRGFDFLAGGSSQGMRGLYYGRNELGLEGEELNNFAASVANDRDLYNQMMTTPTMKEYELNEFRAEANKNAMAQRRGGDPDPISGSQGGEGEEGGESGDGTTDPGSGAVPYSPALQNYYTFFDPTLGKYRSGTYDEYLQYVTAKDGGIIQLENGGETEEEQFVKDNKIVNLRNILSFIRDNKEMPVNTEGQKQVQDETDKLLGDMLKERFTDMEGIRGLTVQSGDAVKMAEEDQPVRDIFGKAKESLDGIFQNLKGRPDLVGEPETTASMIVLDNRDGKLKVVPRNRETLEMLRNGTYSQTNRDAIESGVMVSPSPIDYLEGEDMETMQMKNRSFPMIRNEGPISSEPDITSILGADRVLPGSRMEEVELPARILRGKEGDESMIRRSTSTVEPTMYKVADGGIIGLKEGGMNDMMQADSLMFNDPSDEGQWEYNV